MTVVIIIAAVLLVYIAASCYIEIREQIRDAASQVRELRSDLIEVHRLLSNIDGWGAQLHDDLIRMERKKKPPNDQGDG